MNWQLLGGLIAGYIAVVYFLAWLARLGTRYLRRRFFAEFGQDLSEENIEGLPPDERARWDCLWREDYGRTQYRLLELLYILVMFPAVLVLQVILKRDFVGGWSMFLFNGALYVGIFYWLLG